MRNLVVGLVVALLIAACGGDEQVQPKAAGASGSTAIPGPTTVPKGALPGWTPEEISKLNCTGSPNIVVQFCNCCYERVTIKYTPSQIDAAKADYFGGNQSNPVIADLKSAFDYCSTIY